MHLFLLAFSLPFYLNRASGHPPAAEVGSLVAGFYKHGLQPSANCMGLAWRVYDDASPGLDGNYSEGGGGEEGGRNKEGRGGVEV